MLRLSCKLEFGPSFLVSAGESCLPRLMLSPEVGPLSAGRLFDPYLPVHRV